MTYSVGFNGQTYYAMPDKHGKLTLVEALYLAKKKRFRIVGKAAS